VTWPSLGCLGMLPEDMWVLARAPQVHDGDEQHQGSAHLTFLIRVYGYLGCVWERTG
jgi:hypothetical protein